MPLEHAFLRARGAPRRAEQHAGREPKGDVPLSTRVQPCPHNQQRYTPECVQDARKLTNDNLTAHSRMDRAVVGEIAGR